MNEQVKEAVDRLVAIAMSDTGQSRRVANFLLAWWNAADNGGFDFSDIWNVDSAVAADMVTVFSFVAHRRVYADFFGHQKTMESIWEQWRSKAVSA